MTRPVREARIADARYVAIGRMQADPQRRFPAHAHELHELIIPPRNSLHLGRGSASRG